jgi:hypothetical protein
VLNRLTCANPPLCEAVQGLMELDSRFNKVGLFVQFWIAPSGYGFLEFPFLSREGTIESEATAKEVVKTILGVTADCHLADDWITALCQLFPPQLFEMPTLSEDEGVRITGDALQVIPAAAADVLLIQLTLASELQTLPDSFRRVARAAGFRDAEAIEEHYSVDEDDWEMVDVAMRR